jgi:hypothetical protein
MYFMSLNLEDHLLLYERLVMLGVFQANLYEGVGGIYSKSPSIFGIYVLYIQNERTVRIKNTLNPIRISNMIWLASFRISYLLTCHLLKKY